MLHHIDRAIAGAAGGGFNPSDYGDNRLWFDFGDPSNVFQEAARTTPATTGQSVGGVTDLSGNDFHLFDVSGKPVLGNALNGMLGLYFGENQDLRCNVTGFDADFTAFFVTLIPSNSSENRYLYGSRMSNTIDLYLFNGYWNTGGANSNQQAHANTYKVMTSQRNNSVVNNAVRWNGAAAFTLLDFARSDGDGTQTFGASRDAADSYESYIYEIIWYNGLLSLENIQAVEGYLNDKWAVY